LQSVRTFMDWIRAEADLFKTTRNLPILERGHAAARSTI
jgi:hypothetical protein